MHTAVNLSSHNQLFEPRALYFRTMGEVMGMAMTTAKSQGGDPDREDKFVRLLIRINDFVM